ncbi:MAG: SPFH/Band 7/PHB domain protein [Alphaproteobacteria bacterium]|nr:SPFH/Band 7/PHB domain protein [Alphaproteobacteria bacterium]
MEAVAVALLVLVVVILLNSAVIVRQGYEYTVENFGKYTRLLTPGFHILVPIFERIGAKLNRKEQVLQVSSQEVITKDNAMVKVNGVLFYQIQDAVKAAYQVENLDYAIMNLVMTNIRTVIGSMEIDELLSQRNVINQKLLDVVDVATVPWGVKVTRVEIKDITPPSDLIDSMARQMKAERDKRANILEAEGLRQAEILQAEGQKQSAILEAEGKKEAAFREAEARERSAEAEATATKLVSEAIANGNPNALTYFLGQKYIEALQGIVTSPNEKLLMLPVDATQVMGTVAGISELVKDSLKKNPNKTPKENK